MPENVRQMADDMFPISEEAMYDEEIRRQMIAENRRLKTVRKLELRQIEEERRRQRELESEVEKLQEMQSREELGYGGWD